MTYILFILFLSGLAWYFSKRHSKNKTVYLDTGKTSEVFRSTTHRIAAKPDRIEQGSDGYAIPHEYKSRKNGVKKRDLVQIKTAAIALRDSGYKVKNAVLEVGSGKQHTFNIEPTDELMQGEVGDLIRVVRSIKRGEIPKPRPAESVCRRCSYKTQCPYSQH